MCDQPRVLCLRQLIFGNSAKIALIICNCLPRNEWAQRPPMIAVHNEMVSGLPVKATLALLPYIDWIFLLPFFFFQNKWYSKGKHLLELSLPHPVSHLSPLWSVRKSQVSEDLFKI